MLKAIIIDDEIRSISVLTDVLKEIDGSVNVVGTALNVKSGIELIQKTEFDILFLDIEMPDGTGFGLLDALDSINFDIIFITAFNQYAIKAFRYAALDYLMKPIIPEELEQAISRVKAFQKNEVARRVDLLLENHKTENQFKKIAVATSAGIHYLNVEGIIRCEADGSYTTLYIKDKKPVMVSKSLKEYENLLPEIFLRVHKSHLVNSKFIAKFNNGDNASVQLADNTEISVSRRRKSIVQEMLNSN